MTNAELFKKVFGIYAEEFWAYPEEKMLDWLTSDAPTADAHTSDAPTADVVDMKTGKVCFYKGMEKFNYCPNFYTYMRGEDDG